MYEGFEIQEAIPEASSMIETFRAIGYNLETAVADIIDNSKQYLQPVITQ